MKNGHHIALSFFLLLVCFIIGDACTAGYPIKNGLAHGVFFGTLAAVFMLPVALAAGVLITYLLKKVVDLPRSVEAIFENYLHIPLSLTFLFTNLQAYSGDGFESYISDDRPPSLVIDARCLRSAFGYREWMFAFKIDPDEAEMVMSRYNYELEDVSEEKISQNLAHYMMQFRDVSIPGEYADFTTLHTHHVPDAESDLSTGSDRTVFSSPSSGHYLIFGSDD